MAEDDSVDSSTDRVPCLVLDATELTRDWLLAGVEFQLLGYLIQEGRVRLCIPSSVLIEAIANYQRALADALQVGLRASRLLSRLGVDIDRGIFSQPQYGYQDFLTARIEALGAITLPWPTSSHESITERAVQRRPPFNQSGSGYRDTLVWLSCLDLARAGETVVLATRDAVFYKDDELASELVTETKGLPGSISLARELGPWISQNLPWQGVSLRAAADQVRDEAFLQIFAPWDMFDDGESIEAFEFGLPESSILESVAYVGSADFEKVEVERNDRRQVQTSYRFSVDFEIDAIVDQEFVEAENLEWSDTPILGRVAISETIRMWALMQVEFDARNDDGENSPFEIVNITWTPERRFDDSFGRIYPGPDQLMLDFRPED